MIAAESTSAAVRRVEAERDQLKAEVKRLLASRRSAGHTAGCVAGVVCEPYCEADR